MLMKTFTVCPYCQGSLTLRFFKKDNKSFGIAKCTCDEYPIVEGILYLLKDDRQTGRRAVNFLKRAMFVKAIWECLTNSAKAHKTIVFGAYLSKRYLKAAPPLPILLKVLQFTGPARDWFRYLIVREERNDIHLAYQLVQKLKRAKGVFVDVGFGIGNFLGLAAKGFPAPQGTYIGIDKSFLSLLIATLYLERDNLLLVCSDVETGIPLRERSATCVLFLDSFWQIHKKRFATAESSRVLKKGDPIFIVNIYETTPKTYLWGYGIKSKDLNSYLETNFVNIKFMNNVLTPKREIKFLPAIKVPKEGYSVMATKK